MLGSILLHLLLCRIFKIDRDTALITSMAAIFGPAFIPTMSQALKRPVLLATGVSCGLIGYGVGNFIGLMMAYLLKPN